MPVTNKIRIFATQKDTKMKLINISRTATDHQVYMQSFCEAWIAGGGDYITPSRWAHSRWAVRAMKLLAICRLCRPVGSETYLVCARGGHLLRAAMPYAFKGNIVPMLWDCWPDTWKTLERDLRLLRCQVCHVTSTDVAKQLAKRLPQIKFIYIHEGVATNDYHAGAELSQRSIDVYELGDKHNYYHKRLIDSPHHEQWNFVYNADRKQKGMQLTFDSFSEFTQNIADSKIVVSFPKSMRDPRRNGIVSTLTIRYWEAMLSRCIIVGHCPQELIDIIGYNPVIEADFVNAAGQIDHILKHLDHYQPMVDYNRKMALKYASWQLNDILAQPNHT